MKTLLITLVLFLFVSISCEKDIGLEIDCPNDRIIPTLYNIRNNDNQSDWLQTMSILRLSEVTGNEMGACIITFHVPEGDEKECAEKFEEYDLVQWARFYYYVPINPNP